MKSRPNAIIDQDGRIIVQTPMPPFNSIALEGGGSRCAAYPGLYKVLKKTGLLDEIEYVSGSSGGAICAMVMALGYDEKEAEEIMMDLNMEVFLEGYHKWLSNGGIWTIGKTIWSLWRSTTHALSSGEAFYEWLQKIVERKMGNKLATFGDLADLVEKQKREGGSKFKYLYITATDLSIAIPECKTLSHEDPLFRDMPIALGGRMSASFPFVFKPMEWKGHLYGDGGLIRNLPTQIFQHERFLPKSYRFNVRGINPGVLAVKVDSQDEINQILWNILKEADLSSAGAIASAVYNALAQNTDTEEIREGRTVIALPDNNISSLEFSVDKGGKLDLISSAERETQNFVENHYNTAYDIKTYPNVIAWLDAITLDEIDAAMVCYEEMLNNLRTKRGVEPLAPELDEKVDPNNPGERALLEYLNFLEGYFHFRRLKARFPEAVYQGVVPRFHINIAPLPVVRWSDVVKDEMQIKLKHIAEQMHYARKRMEWMKSEFSDVQEVSEKTLLHDDVHFDNIQALTSMHEYYKILTEEKKDLETKLGMTIKKKKAPGVPGAISPYEALWRITNPMRVSTSQEPELKAVLLEQFHLTMFESCDNKKIVFMCDLHDEMDRKTYILAASYFLNYKKSAHLKMFNELYRDFVSDKVPLPKNLAMLGTALNIFGVELLMTAYRIEELIHYFEKVVNPKSKPTIYLDTLFGTPKKSFKKSQEGIVMKHIVSKGSIFSARVNYVGHPGAESSADPLLTEQESNTYLSGSIAKPGDDEESPQSPPTLQEKPLWFMSPRH